MNRIVLHRLAVATAALGLGAAAVPALAESASEIFLCTDADGRKTYQNTGTGKGCRRLEVQPVLTLPAPRAPVRRATSEPRAVSPASFPRIDGETQRSRDGDRRRILEEELAAEETKLQSIRAEYNNGEPERIGGERNYARYQERVARLQADLQRTENNVASLKRELALLARQ